MARGGKAKKKVNEFNKRKREAAQLAAAQDESGTCPPSSVLALSWPSLSVRLLIAVRSRDAMSTPPEAYELSRVRANRRACGLSLFGRLSFTLALLPSLSLIDSVWLIL